MNPLKIGDSGPLVKELQELLVSQGIPCIIDSSFGPMTKKAVKDFQAREKLKADGIVGDITWAALIGPKNHDSEFEFGKSYSPDEFKSFVNGTVWTGWKPSLIVIHHTAAPSLAQRPNGFTKQHMINIKDYYDSLGWSAGPHLFVDEDKIWTFSNLIKKGIHAKSFNSTSLGIEMLGNYDIENPKAGRGLEVIKTTVEAVKILMHKLCLDKKCLKFHRDDPLTSKTCPGDNISKEWFLSFFN